MAAFQILGVGADLYTGQDQCQAEMACLVNAFSPKGAITLGHTISIGGESMSESLATHEHQHVLDLESTGSLGFYSTYLGHSAILKLLGEDSYHGIIWEQRAHERQHSPDAVSSIGSDSVNIGSKAAKNINRGRSRGSVR